MNDGIVYNYTIIYFIFHRLLLDFIDFQRRKSLCQELEIKQGQANILNNFLPDCENHFSIPLGQRKFINKYRNLGKLKV